LKNNIEEIIRSVSNSFFNLLDIKRNYFELLNDDPHQRVRSVPLLLNYEKPIEANVGDYYFDTMIEKGETSDYTIITVIINDYNTLLNLWSLRNKYFKKMTDHFDNGVPHEAIMNGEEGLDYIHLIDLTELLIRFTDEILLSMVEFLKHSDAFDQNIAEPELLGNCREVDEIIYIQALNQLAEIKVDH